MPRPLTEHERQEFFSEPRVGVLIVANENERSPLTVPVWYGYRPGGNATFFTGTQGRKARKTRLIRKAGVLSLSVQREQFPYRYVTVEGTVVGEARPPSAEQMLAVARRSLPGEVVRGSLGGAWTPLERARAVHDPSRPLADRRLPRLVGEVAASSATHRIKEIGDDRQGAGRRAGTTVQ
jgi:nitroimidazol reductase NimA-like FMN-containing flavoprotein (pyridoxamine 5'-phosphate oxidase superfamily)